MAIAARTRPPVRLPDSVGDLLTPYFSVSFMFADRHQAGSGEWADHETQLAGEVTSL